MDTLIMQREFKDVTLRNHKAVIKRLNLAGYVFPTKQGEAIPELIKFLEAYPKANVKLTLLNTVLVCRDIAGKPTTKIKELRMSIAKNGKVENVATMNRLGKTLMKKAEFKTLLDEAYDRNLFIKYIINYLWYTYGVRNQDVDVILVKTKAEMTDLTKNYLYLRRKQIVYSRNVYKTSATYGAKTHIITDEKFITACFNQSKRGMVLFTGDKIANDVRKWLINGMTESNIFKMLIADAVENKDTDLINVLSNTRGSSIAGIKEYYNTHAVVEVIRKN